MTLFARHDLDGFFGLFVDNLVQLLLIVSLCGGLCGMTGVDARFITEAMRARLASTDARELVPA